ncbi:MAG: hypothetical protein HZA62_05845 [Rhodocyclales bacterium]|nr:hypothetical protein [Rhodocyclales bacterium]
MTLMNGRLASMERKLDELERMIGEPHSNHGRKAAGPAGTTCRRPPPTATPAPAWRSRIARSGRQSL